MKSKELNKNYKINKKMLKKTQDKCKNNIGSTIFYILEYNFFLNFIFLFLNYNFI